MSTDRMQDKIAVITGGTQGLGAAIARHMAKEGAAGLITVGRNAERGQSVADEIMKTSDCQVKFVQAELSDVKQCKRVIEEAERTFGAVDSLVNAAALTDRGTILDTTPEFFDRMFAINVRAPYFLIQETVRLMIRDQREGTIVNIGSMSAEAGQPFISAYCASKGALSTLTRNTAYSLLRNRIRVNQLNIGWMGSDGEDRIQKTFHDADDDWLQKAGATQPFGRLINPEEVARAVTFLSSEESGLMTGSVVNYDQSVWAAYDGSPQPDSPMRLD